LPTKSGREKPEYAHLDDTDLIQMVAQKKPDLLANMDRADMAQIMRDSRKKKISQQRQKEFGSLSGVSRFGAGTGQGMLDVWMGIKQLLGGDTSKYKDDKQAYMDASEGDIAAGAGEIFGGIAATGPVPGFTGAKLAGKVASPLLKKGILAGTALATGAGYGAIEHVDEGETRARNALMGTLFGGAGYGAGKLVSKLGAKTVNAIKGKMKDAPTQEIWDLMKKYGIDLEISDITSKGKTLSKFLEGIPIVGTGAKAGKTAGEVAGAIKKKAGTIQDDWEEGIQASLRRKAKAGKVQAQSNYDKVDELSGNATIKPTNALEKAKQHELDIADDVLGSGENPFTKLKDNLSGAKTFKQLRKAREDLGNAAQKAKDSQDRNLARQLNDIKKGVEFDIDDLVKGGREDAGAIVTDVSPEKYGRILDEYKKAGAIDDLAETMSGFGEHKGVIQRMANYVKLNGNKKNKGSNLLVREHIPGKQFGSSSDEMAANLNMDESDFMQMLDDLPIKSKKPVKSSSMDYPADWDDVVEQKIQPKAGVMEAYKKARKDYRKNVVPYHDTKIVNALKSNTPDEIYEQFIKKGKGDKAKNFYNLLDDKGKKSLRDGFLENAIVKQDGSYNSPAKIAGYIERMAKPKTSIFKGSDLEELNGFAKIMRHSARYGQLNESPSNGMQLIPYLKGGALLSAGYGASEAPVRTAAGVAIAGGLTGLMSFMRTKGKRFTLASDKYEIGSKAFEKELTRIMSNIPKISALQAQE